MIKLNLAAVAVIAALSSAAQAEINLIAIGEVNVGYEDLSLQTAQPLENGNPGNSLGGIGSGLAYAGGNTFIGLPDRGPNAVSYNSEIDDTTSYIPRFHTFSFSLAASPAGAALPYVLSPHLQNTTLLSSRDPLVYGANTPALNSKNGKSYFSGRSDNFNASHASNSRRNGRLDPEAVRVSHDGRDVFISDEYGPYIYQFNRKSGERVRSIKLPEKFAVSSLNSKGDSEISANASGRVANKGMEGLAISPSGKTLFGAMQSPLLQDGGSSAGFIRIVAVDLNSGMTREYAYPLENVGSAAKPKYLSVSEIVAINNHQFLVDERDGKGLGDNSVAVHKKIFQVDLNGAVDASDFSGAASLATNAVSKSLFIDIVSKLNAFGIASQDIPAKIEGMAFGPDININGVNKHTLYISNDNDFLATIVDGLHPSGVENNNKIYVFAIDESDLSGFVAQDLRDGKHCD